MKHIAIVLIALLAACPALAAAAQPNNYVVVDPNDLRQPVPDPEQGLSDKYNEKVVRFSGAVQRASLDRSTNKYWFELHYDIVNQKPDKDGKPVVVNKETIVVVVGFQNNERSLRGRRPGFNLTVEGRASVQVDGSLVITDAVIVADDSVAPRK